MNRNRTMPNTYERAPGARDEALAAEARYHKPELRPLGRWNVFTRQASPNTVDNPSGDGFFEFNLLGD